MYSYFGYYLQADEVLYIE